jgi:hypothetical protein
MDVRRKEEMLVILGQAIEELEQTANTLLDEDFRGEAAAFMRIASMIRHRRNFIEDNL